MESQNNQEYLASHLSSLVETCGFKREARADKDLDETFP